MKLHKPQHTLPFLAIVCIVCGITVYFGTGTLFLMKQRFSNNSAVLIPSQSPTPRIYGPPISITIPKIGKNLPIKPATVRGNDWDMFDDAVAWLSTSAVPGEGNVILYAHDWPTLWKDLYLLTPGDLIEVFQEGTGKRTYVVTVSKAVDQHDIQSILSDENRLTLYTCEGNFDQKRRVVYADMK
jgi:LPXTG-site transpeptidase (sortase) family protein